MAKVFHPLCSCKKDAARFLKNIEKTIDTLFFILFCLQGVILTICSFYTLYLCETANSESYLKLLSCPGKVDISELELWQSQCKDISQVCLFFQTFNIIVIFRHLTKYSVSKKLMILNLSIFHPQKTS